MGSPRHAKYYAPPRDSLLASFGAALLGHDVWSGEDAASAQYAIEAAADWRELTADPRRYGFHATLKPPFTLAPGQSEAAPVAACEAFAETPRPVPVIRPTISAIAGFIAVTAEHRSDELRQLAFDGVTAFDGFRQAPRRQIFLESRNGSWW